MKNRSFLKNFEKLARNAVSADIPSENIDVWFQDEARIGQRGTQTRIWAKRGTRPRVIRQQQFEYAYLYGAVCPDSGQTAGLVLPVANTDAMELHLDEISRKITEGRHAVVIMDRAGWHTTQKLKKHKNLTPIFLPPYSPELNPIEQVWQWLRDHDLANRCFDGYDDILKSSAKAWMNFSDSIDIVKSLCSRDWASLST
jgi:transposase